MDIVTVPVEETAVSLVDSARGKRQRSASTVPHSHLLSTGALSPDSLVTETRRFSSEGHASDTGAEGL